MTFLGATSADVPLHDRRRRAGRGTWCATLGSRSGEARRGVGPGMADP
ncbi:hypothetical protein Ae505Ps2_5635c [Pseudonocardia sp. Ae505_Ps2]|nr:hypothetical protein Ae505Ps2_5635c [Pseudonocardia sp. Ae505_Ps2]